MSNLGIAREGRAVFFPSCYGHAFATKDAFESVRAGKTTMKEAVDEFLFPVWRPLTPDRTLNHTDEFLFPIWRPLTPDRTPNHIDEILSQVWNLKAKLNAYRT